jgi:hypothetical protein
VRRPMFDALGLAGLSHGRLSLGLANRINRSCAKVFPRSIDRNGSEPVSLATAATVLALARMEAIFGLCVPGAKI